LPARSITSPPETFAFVPPVVFRKKIPQIPPVPLGLFFRQPARPGRRRRVLFGPLFPFASEPLNLRPRRIQCLLSLIYKTLFAISFYIRYKSAMPELCSIPLPAAHALRTLGRDLGLARRKRGISTEDMAARLFVSRTTLWRMERGDPTVSLGTLATAAFILQLHDRLAHLAAPATDALALSLDERRLPKRIRRARA
jgi:DNA-binding XRE family transcriptional regulator